jgi:hypothetical protein
MKRLPQDELSQSIILVRKDDPMPIEQLLSWMN